MAKFSELTAITSITDSDLMMITDAETSASRKITWANVKGSINSALTISGESNNAARLTVTQANDGTDAPDIMFKNTNKSAKSPRKAIMMSIPWTSSAPRLIAGRVAPLLASPGTAKSETTGHNI